GEAGGDRPAPARGQPGASLPTRRSLSRGAGVAGSRRAEAGAPRSPGTAEEPAGLLLEGRLVPPERSVRPRGAGTLCGGEGPRGPGRGDGADRGRPPRARNAPAAQARPPRPPPPGPRSPIPDFAADRRAPAHRLGAPLPRRRVGRFPPRVREAPRRPGPRGP